MNNRRARWIGISVMGAAAAGGAYRLRRSSRAARRLPPSQTWPPALVAPLAAFDAGDVAVAGGKGANLGELTRAGFPVPPGFVVTTPAYERFVDDSGLRATLDEALMVLDPADLAAVEQVATRIHDAFRAAAIPPDIAGLVRGAYRELASAREAIVAVRSSATAEDTAGAAAAGQQETLLNISGEEAVLSALRECWASLWTPRAIVYRAHQGLAGAGATMAVVVQTMVPAEVAGVVFTIDPVSGARGRLVINATPGLGEALVAGRITPDHLVLNRRGLRIVELRPARDGHPALPESAASELGGIALSIERHFGTPQDIEWALAGGRFSVLQARPITNLAQLATHNARARQNLAEAGDRIPVRPYPIDLTFLDHFTRTLFDALFGTFGVSMPSFGDVLIVEDGVVTGIRELAPRPTARIIYKPWLSMWRSRHYDPARMADDPVLREALRRAAELAARDLRALRWDELLQMVQEIEAIVPLTADLRRRYFPRVAPGLLRHTLLLLLAGQTRHNAALMTGVHNKSIEINEALEELAAQVRADERLRRIFAETDAHALPAILQAEPAAAAFRERFADFLHRYGQREYLTLPSHGTWRNVPEIPLGMLKAMAASEPRSPEAGPVAWERARDAVLSGSFLGIPPFRAPYLRALEQARMFAQLREDTHFYLGTYLPLLHDALLEIGRRLVDVGALDEPRDVIHLHYAEIKAVRDWPLDQATIECWRDSVARREAKRETLGPWQLGTLDPLSVALDPTALLAGIAASAGTASGPVCIVQSPAEFGKLRPGDVLVAPYTDPAWTPLFTRAVAVIADNGGMGSHSAIVAREYGLPAVLGTAEATRRLQDGQQVLVDGNRGLVLPAPG